MVCSPPNYIDVLVAQKASTNFVTRMQSLKQTVKIPGKDNVVLGFSNDGLRRSVEYYDVPSAADAD